MSFKQYILLGLFILMSGVIEAQEFTDNADRFIATISKVREGIVLDGLINETDWASASWSSQFWTKFPVVAQGANPRTEVALVFDDDHMYVAVKCYSDQSYVIQTLKRDKEYFNSDGFGFVIDPVNQKTNGFMFGVNAMGVRSDAIITADSRNAYEPDWDNRWYSNVQHYEDHWTAEFAIPFKTLRYESDVSEWGINFIRNHITNNEYHTWAPVPLQFQGVNLGYLGTLQWNEAPKAVKGNVTLIPYTSASSLVTDDIRSSDLQFGIDAKIALSSSMNLDLTINPDFSQVEVDEQPTNLTRFSIRLPEKRTFFLENDDIFSNFGSANARPFFSRRIGLSESGSAVPIDYGFRLSGNINESVRLGLFNAHQHAFESDPAQNFTALAIHKKVFDRSSIRGFLMNRQAYRNAEFDMADYGRNAGLEFTYVSKNGELESWAGYNRSFKKGIDDENNLLKYGVTYNSRTLRLKFSATERGTNYYTDLGFSNNIINYDASRDTSIRLGSNQYYIEGTHSIYPENESSKINRHRIGAENLYVKNTDGVLSENTARIKYFLSFDNQSQFQVRLNDFTVNLRYPFSFTDGEPLPATKYNFQSIRLNYESDTKRKLGYSASTEMGSFYSGHKMSFSGGLRYRVQPWGNFQVMVEYNDLNFAEIYGDTKLYRIIPRIEINFSKELFWTTFIQYNSLLEQFGINSRIHWRFRPMSDVFLVYNDSRNSSTFNDINQAITLKINYWINP